ncbi:hypothetical protein [Foetidibacter luteolus]|nr:hypothetical protein [Foetidibacter luteolus]
MAAGLKRKARSHEVRVARTCSEKPELLFSNAAKAPGPKTSLKIRIMP